MLQMLLNLDPVQQSSIPLYCVYRQFIIHDFR